MRYLLMLCISLSIGCVNYDLQTAAYIGAVSDGDVTVGSRIGSYLIAGDKVDAGVFIDGAYSALDSDVDMQSLSPLLAAKWKPYKFLQPYIMAGPSFVSYQQGSRSDSDLGTDFRAGVEYRLGSVHGIPSWLFVEFRFLNADIEYEEKKPVGQGISGATYHRKSAEPDNKGRTVRDKDYDWTFNTLIGVSLRW